MVHELSGIEGSDPESGRVDRQSGPGKVMAHADGICGRTQSEIDGKIERHDHADGNCLAVKQTTVVAAGCFQGMGECVSEIEEGSPRVFPFVPGDDCRLGGAALLDGVLQVESAAGQH